MLSERYVNPFTDYGFKRLFGVEPNKDILIAFLNQILPAPHQVEDLSYAPTEQMGSTEPDRKAIFDVYCVSPSGERFIVEIQKSKQNFFKDRSVFYATFPIQEQAQKGTWNFQLSAVYLVGILDFVFDESRTGEVRHVVNLKNQYCEVFYDKLTLIYLEMPKFQKTEEELESNFDKWMYLLRNLPNLPDRPMSFQERVFQKFFDVAEIARFNQAEYQAYEHSLKYYRDMNNVIDTSYQEGLAVGFDKGHKTGLATGLSEGLAKGIAKGIEQGEAAKTRAIVLQAIRLGLPPATIAELSGLTIEAIQQIVNEPG